MIGKGASLGPKGQARWNVTSMDSSLPAAGSGVDCTGFQYVLLYVKVTGSGTFDLTPCYYRDEHAAYIKGDKVQSISDSAVIRLEADGSDDLFPYLDNKSGTVTRVDIEYQLMNRT